MIFWPISPCALGAGERVRIIPTCVDPGSYPLLPSGYARHVGGAAVDLVWIGSSSTLRGLEQQRPLWERLGRGSGLASSRHLRSLPELSCAFE